MYIYLLLNIIAFVIPFVLSFEKTVALISRHNFSYAKRWRYLFPAIILTSIFFIVWDSIFTHMGIWGFNPSYLTGVYILNLPIEEWLFFITIPYACVYTFEAVNFLPNIHFFEKRSVAIAYILATTLIILSLIFYDRLYTFITFLLLGVFLLALAYFIKPSFLGRFFVAYLFILVPFSIINGILTGSGLASPVVWYNNAENLGIRIYTIPVEDVFYGMLLILMNVSIYEFLQKKI